MQDTYLSGARPALAGDSRQMLFGFIEDLQPDGQASLACSPSENSATSLISAASQKASMRAMIVEKWIE
jgi:hypothetical protein